LRQQQVRTASANADVMQPSLGINYIICTAGIFSSRQ
jgi:microcystin-dependent protein